MKECTLCKNTLPVSSFWAHKRNKTGYSSWCISCSKVKAAEAYQKHKEKAKKRAATYKQENKDKVNHWCMKRYLAKKHRVPKWLTEDDWFLIEETYSLATLRSRITGFLWEVDHILPLQGKLVSGLHTPTNLQIIPAILNAQKGNHYVPSI